MTRLSQHVRSSTIFGKHHQYYLPGMAKLVQSLGPRTCHPYVGMRDCLENNSMMAGELDVHKQSSGLASFVLRIVTRGRELLLPFYLQSRSTESNFCHWFSRPNCSKGNVPDLALSQARPSSVSMFWTVTV